MVRILTDDHLVQYSSSDGWVQKTWLLNDIEEVHGPSWYGEVPTDALGGWISVGWSDPSRSRWMVPRDDLRFSAGVPLKLTRTLLVIPSHLGEILVLQKQNWILNFVLLSSFIDGLHVVRQQFERELEEGRRTATTAEERVSNLRKCRERMTAFSDQVVMEHMKMLPVEWKDGSVAEGSFQHFECRTVLHLTTPDGRVVDCKDETNVAVVGDDWHIIIRVRKDGKIDAESKRDCYHMLRMSPESGSRSCFTKAFAQQVRGDVYLIRYVRDPDSKTDDFQVCKFLGSDCAREGREMVSVRGGSEAACRWLLFGPEYCCDLAVCDTQTGKMAHLRTQSEPSGAMETSEGLWMWGLDFMGNRWSQLFKVEALESLEYKDLSTFNKPTDPIERRVVDNMLDAEAFCKATRRRGLIRNEGRHPGHYWVVAGYGPVPISLRAPDHIYKELETFDELRRYEHHFPIWSSFRLIPSAVVEIRSPGTWSGAVDVRDGVTAESIKEDPKSDAWRVGMPMQSGVSGEFSVTGNTLSMQLFSFVPLELPVKPGRWLWRVDHHGSELELTLRHESVAAADIAKCTAPARLVDSRKLECYLTQLRSLAPVIPEEGLRAKIAAFGDWLYPPTADSCHGAILLDKNVIDKDTEWHVLIGDQEQVIPLAGGLAVDCKRGLPEVFVGENMIRLAFRNSRDETWWL